MNEITCGVNTATIIQKLFAMDVLKNSNQSVLVGILGLYTGSKGQTDCILLDVMRRIDETSSMNITSSYETWGAFRSGISRVNVEAISSSLESPFPVIDTDRMRNDIALFDVSPDSAEPVTLDEAEILTTSYDPKFWLPVIAYCLEKATHSSEITLLIGNYSIGYALACLSSKSETVRKMASSILLRWEELSQARFPTK
jgi:hypothetical protein